MRIGVLLLVVSLGAAALGVLAISGGSVMGAVALFWCSLSLSVVGLAYARLGASVLGKRTDGTLPFLRLGLLLPYFLVTWSVWHLMRLGKECCWDEVAPGVYLGRRAFARELPSDTGLIVDLTAEFPRTSAPRQVAYRCLPTLDGWVPSEAQCRQLLHEIVGTTTPLYVHCAQGHGRSALIVGALLVARGLASSPDRAVQRMKERRPGVRLSASQQVMLERLCAGLVTD